MWVTDEQLKAENAEKNVIRRQAIEMSHDADIVAHFVHNRAVDLKKLRFEKMATNSNKSEPVITLNEDVCDNVAEIGTEVNCINDGFDFAIAIVDTETGTTRFRPARFYQFETKYAEEMESVLGSRTRDKRIDYAADYDITADKWGEKRRALTDNFGSAKKIKMAEASERRTIKQDTLDEMRKTAFASSSNLKTEQQEDVKPTDITLLNKASSSILPPANDSKIPREIYPLSLFLSDAEIEAVAEDALELMSKKRREKVECGVPEAVIYIMGDEKKTERAAGYLLLSTMVAIIQKLGKTRNVLRKELNDLKLPEVMNQKVQAEYFIGAESARGFRGTHAERVKLNVAEYDRLVAYTLALALTLAPDHKIPFTPFQIAFGCAPSKIEKILQGLGAEMIRLDPTAAQEMRSMRAAVLLKPPSGDVKGTRKLKRR